MDKSIGFLLTSLARVNLINKLNIIIVSDAGLTKWKQTYLIKDYLSETLINFTPSVYGVVSSLYPKSDSVASS